MPSSDVELIKAQIQARKRHIHAQAVAGVGRQLQRRHNEMLAEVESLKATCEALSRTYVLLYLDASQALAEGDPPPLPDVRELETLVRRVPTHLSAIGHHHQQAVDMLNELLQSVQQPPAGIDGDEEVARLQGGLTEAIKQARGEIKKRIAEDEWADLPYYGGDSAREREECLHCGNELEDEQKAYCCEHCKEVHQSVFGVSDEEGYD